MLKYLKLGFGKVTDNVNEQIRQGLMTREHALELVKRYDGQCGRDNILGFCRFIDITEDEFWQVVAQYVNRDLFEPDANLRWKPKFVPV